MNRIFDEFGIFERTGRLHSVRGSLHARVRAAVGEQVYVRSQNGSLIPGEVIGFDDDLAQILPMVSNAQFKSEALVIARGYVAQIPVGRGLLGRVVDSRGEPIDRRGPLLVSTWQTLANDPIPATQRPIINRVLPTGIRAIDGFLTIGQGQRIGIFAGSGVGKSTLLGDLAKNSSADLNVIAMVGERGREVKPFIEYSLGKEGMKKSVVVVATSDEPPINRIRAADAAVSIADHFRKSGHNVLLMMDSITRYATAQKELGLMLGEPPASRGYPASVFQKMATLLEQLGNSEDGSITGFITVLVDGDDLNEPVADAARSILDGHIVLKRELAEKSHYPAIDILASVSRLFRELCSQDHIENSATIRRAIALYREVEDLIRIGAYKKGNVAATDQAIDSIDQINEFLCQSGAGSEFELTQSKLSDLAAICQGLRG